VIAKTVEDLEEIRRKCRRMVNVRAAAAGVASGQPVPIIDMGADYLILKEMIPAITKRFGLNDDQISSLSPELQTAITKAITAAGVNWAKKKSVEVFITSLLKRAGSRTAKKTATRFMGPIGWIVGGGIGFASIKVIGTEHINECYNICLSVLEAKRLDVPPAPAEASA
jgi:uncharacterized protein (DUF697 family)